jgi:23S rRNA (adenine2030-N6)-methyltransferase
MHFLRRVQRFDAGPLPQLRRRVEGAPAAAGMNYRHAYHAGNFADVMKHAALVCAIDCLKRKDKPFRVIDTHAGRGLYDLAGREAAKTSEADTGISRLEGLTGMPPVLVAYRAIVADFGAGHYPGSPLIAARLLRPGDRLIAIEKHPEEFAALSAALRPYGNAKAEEADGYARLAALLPPPERRGIVLIDPPYEEEGEFACVARSLAGAYRRFATGIYLIWFPVKRRSDGDALAGEMLALGVTKLVSLKLGVGRAPGAPPERLAESGLLIVNPPFGFGEKMQAVLAFLATRLVQGEGAYSRIERLAGE